MWLEIIVGVIVLISVLIIIFLLKRSNDPIAVNKKVEGGNVFLKIRANKDLVTLVVSSPGPDGVLVLRRSSIKRGESVEFQVPFSNSQINVTIEDEKGTKTQEIPA